MVVVDLMLVRVESGEEGGETGTADTGGGVAVDEAGRMSGEAVEIGSVDGAVAHEAKVPVALVIGDDEENVGAGLRMGETGSESKGNQEG